MLFESDIIYNPTYHQSSGLRSGLLATSLFVGFVLWSLGPQLDDFWTNLTHLPYIFLLGGFFLLCLYLNIAVYYSSRQMDKIGSLELSNQAISIEVDGYLELYSLKELKEVELIRRTYYHKGEHAETTYIGDNHLRFRTNDGAFHDYEFTLNSVDHNREFEYMVSSLLKSSGPRKIKYKSV